jgi:WD40 repeat protein
MSDLFISYAKADNSEGEISNIETQLRNTPSRPHPSLKIDVWFDENNIRAGEYWKKEIEIGIEKAHVIAIFLSPRYFASKVCNEELAKAKELGKKIILLQISPVSAGAVELAIKERQSQGKETATLQEALSNYASIKKNQYILYDMDTSVGKQDSFDRLVSAIFENATLDDGANVWLERQLAKERKTGNWLTGDDLREAEKWLAETAKTPLFVVHDKTRQYIVESRKANNRRRLAFSTISIVAVLTIIVIGILGIRQFIETQRNRSKAQQEQVQKESLRITSLAQEAYDRGDQFLAFALALESNQIVLPNPSPAAFRTLVNFSRQPGARKRIISENRFFSVAISPDGQTAVSASCAQSDSDCIQGKLTFWDVTTGKQLHSFTGHTARINSVEFSPDGKTLLSSSMDETLILWDVASGNQLRAFIGHAEPVYDTAFSPDGQTMISISLSKLILWDMANGNQLHTFTGEIGDGHSVAFSPDGQTVISSTGNELILWDVASGQQLHSFLGHTNTIWDIAFSPDGKTVLSSSMDETLILWDVASGNQLRAFTEHTEAVYTMAFSPDGQMVLSGSGDGAIIFWEVATGNALQKLLGHTAAIWDLTFSPDGKTAISASNDQSLIFWDMTSGEEISHWRGNENSTLSNVIFSPNGTLAISTGCRLNESGWCNQGEIILWDIAKEKQLNIFSPAGTAAFSPDGDTIAYNSGNKVFLWDITLGEQLGEFLTDMEPVTVEFSLDGQTIFSLYSDRMIFIDIASGVQTQYPLGLPDYEHLAISTNGQMVLSSSILAGQLLSWDVASGEVILIISGHTDRILDVAISPDGQTALSASADKTLILWNLETGEAIRTFSGHTFVVNTIAFSPDGQTVLSGSCRQEKRATECVQGEIILWDVKTGEILHTFIGHTDRVSSVAFSPDGQSALSVSPDNTAILWRIDSPEEIIEWTCNNRYVYPLTDYDRQVYKLDQKPNVCDDESLN